ncbi:MAG: hypothetical protein AAFR96_11130 [Planctomycetota bacterium]
MDWWQIALIVVGCVVVLVLWIRFVATAIVRAGPPPKLHGDSAPGWILECRTCGMWRPAGETGMIRKHAAGEKLQIARCMSCERFRWVRLKRGPGPADKRRIDDRTNSEIWPETLTEAASPAG